MNATVNQVTFGKAALELLGNAPKVRVRLQTGNLEFRPTDRVSGKRLPAGEVLVDIKRAGIFSRADVSAMGVENTDLSVRYNLKAGKHGWYTLEVADKGSVTFA